jgi:hypothetical protein
MIILAKRLHTEMQWLRFVALVCFRKLSFAIREDFLIYMYNYLSIFLMVQGESLLIEQKRLNLMSIIILTI